MADTIVNISIERLIDKVEIVAGQEGFDTILAEKVTDALSKLCFSLRVNVTEEIVQGAVAKIFLAANDLANAQ